MPTRLWIRILIVFLLGAQVLTGSFAPAQVVSAQQAQTFSIITPYYGTKQITSFFDHSAPNYGVNNILVRYDGRQFNGNVSIGTCTTDVNNFPGNTNCYEGHNGLDVGMAYEHILAAADGAVWWAKYAVPNCHNGANCSYGLEVKIKHNVNGQIYSTRYGHLTTLAVQEGQFVKAGQIIGTSGSTGASTGPHLHFDVSICINAVCANDSTDFRAIDPFGWQPTTGADVQNDPWALAQNPNGANSWCMWSDGQFVNLCDSSRVSSPIREPIYGAEYIVDDTVNNTAGFTKGFNGNGNNTCTGVDPGNGTVCREWWETNGTGWGNHSYRTITNGLAGTYTSQDNWAKWQPQAITPGAYEIFVYVPANLGFSNDTFTWQAHYSVVDSTGIPSPKYVDEYIGAGQAYNPRDKWLSLGIHNLNANSAVYVIDDGEPPDAHCPNGTNYNGHVWCRVAADAVKFVQIKYQNFLPVLFNSTDLIANGGFETGDTNSWYASRSNNQGPIVVQYQSISDTYGTYGARLGRFDSNQDTLYQTVTIPANVSRVTWTYSYYIYTQETTTTTMYDVMNAVIQDTYGNNLTATDVYSNLTSTPNGLFVTETHDVTSLAGRTVRVYFHASTDSSNNTWFWIDNISLIVS